MSLPREWSFLQGECPTPTTRDDLAPPHDNHTPQQMEALSSSLLSVQSAPAPAPPPPATPRPSHLPLNYKPGYLQSPPDTNLEEEEHLLTISSLTARPLLAKGIRQRPQTQLDTSSCNYDHVPDGGYGWVVVLGAFLVQFWVGGLVKSYGVLYVEVLETFPGSKASVASWIPAILTCLCLVLAPVSSALCQRFSCRAVVFVGGLCCSAGLALATWATSLSHLFFTFGVLSGIGGGLSTTPGIVIVSQYFEKHRALANGICVSGTAVGSFVFPVIIQHLVDKFGFHGTVLLLGGGMLHVCVSAALYRAPPTVEATRSPPSGTCAPSGATTATEDTLITFSDREDNKDTIDGTKVINNKLEKLFVDGKLSDLDLFMNQKNSLLSIAVDPLEVKTASKLSFKLPSPRNNLICEIVHPSLIEVTQVDPPVLKRSDSDESGELRDVVGEGGMRWNRLLSTRSSGRLHSVEDLTTDSTCVYKARRHLTRSMYIKPMTKRPAFQSDLLTSIAIQDDLKSSENKCNVSEPCLKEIQEDIKKDDEESSCVSSISRYLDLSLMKECRFLLVSGSVALMSTGSPYLLYYLPAHTLLIGHTKSEAGTLVAISAAMDLCGRLLLGWLCDLQIFDRQKAYLVSIILAGMSVLSLPMVTSWWLMAVASGCYGLCLGCWFLLVPVLLTDLFGRERISSSYGLVRMFQSIGAISVPPIAGYICDMTGGYTLVFYMMGSCMTLGAIPMLLVRKN